MQEYELIAKYDSRASFYGKARVKIEGDRLLKLYSYGTKVAQIEYFIHVSPRVKVFGKYSTTTGRHIKEFLRQAGFKAENWKQIEEDYM